MKNKNANEIIKRHAIFYHSDADRIMGIPKPFAEHYTRMFLEDVGHGVMPIGGHTKRKDFAVSISPADPTIEQMIVSAISRREYNCETLTGSLCEFFRLTASGLCAFDRSTHEIAYIADAETQKITGFRLFFINEQQIVKRFRQLYQFVPPEIVKEENVSRMIPLPKEDLIIFTPPAEFQKILRNMREDLSTLSDFGSMFEMVRGDKKYQYDFKTHQNSKELALLKVCRPIGWIARGTFNEKILSFYLVYLQLLFEKFKIRLREEMLVALNDGLRRAGQKIGFSVQLRVTGLPTMIDVEDAMEKLNSGRKPFVELMDPFYNY